MYKLAEGAEHVDVLERMAIFEILKLRTIQRQPQAPKNSDFSIALRNKYTQQIDKPVKCTK